MNNVERIPTIGMTHEEWLGERKNGIGGSDAGAVCGLNPYRSPLAVYQDKTGTETDDTDSESMRQGRDFEDYVARRFMEQTGKKARRANAIYKSTEHPFMYANVDRLIIGENAGLECKTASAYSADKWKDGHIPESYQLQCHHYMAVTGAESWYIAVIILGKDFLWHRIERDEDLIRNLISIESAFWNDHVIPRLMPEPDGSESSERLIRQLAGKAASEKEIPLSGFDEQLKRRMEIAELMDKLDMEKRTIEQKLKLYMGDAEIAENDRYRITWKNSRTERLDTKALKQEQPEIYRKYAKTTESRRFLVKPVA